MPTKNSAISEIINQSACFDLQFRKDTRHERTGSPTYYRWKIQFIITVPKESAKHLQKIKHALRCGTITVVAGQARFSVQDINEIVDLVIPYLKKHLPVGDNKKEFELWQKAAGIIHANKGIYISKWQKKDLLSLLEIHKALSKYKRKPKQAKWLEMAKTLAKTL